MLSTPYATVAFLGIVGFIVVATVAAHVYSLPDEDRNRGRNRAVVLAVAWLLITALPTLTGVMAPTGAIPPQLLMGLVLLMAGVWAATGPGGRIARTVPLWMVVGFQGFRLPLELVLHWWVEAGVAPPQMTWTGQNVDILAGVLALAFIPFVRRSPKAAWIPTGVGVLLLLNIGRIVMTSLPGPMMRFADPLQLPMMFPHVWIGTVCVAGALAWHVIAIRALKHA